MLAKLERIEAIWLPWVGKDPWTIGQYVWELDSVMQHPGEVLHSHCGVDRWRPPHWPAVRSSSGSWPGAATEVDSFLPNGPSAEYHAE